MPWTHLNTKQIVTTNIRLKKSTHLLSKHQAIILTQNVPLCYKHKAMHNPAKSTPKRVDFCATGRFKPALNTSLLWLTNRKKDLTILNACKGMITSDKKLAMHVALKSIVFIYLWQCSQPSESALRNDSQDMRQKQKRGTESMLFCERGTCISYSGSQPPQRSMWGGRGTCYSM